jgi:hypothetical protein
MITKHTNTINFVSVFVVVPIEKVFVVGVCTVAAVECQVLLLYSVQLSSTFGNGHSNSHNMNENPNAERVRHFNFTLDFFV